MIVEVRIDGRPVPWARTRGSGHTRYTPRRQREHADTVGWEVKLRLRDAGVHQPTEGPVEVECEFRFRAPKRTGSPIPPSDTDNLYKLLADAIEGIAYHNDRQVVRVTATKRWARDDATIIRLHLPGA